MASRQLRKLRKQQELLGLQNEAAQDVSSEDEPVVAKPRANLFAGFAALGDEGGGEDDDDETDHDDAESKNAHPEPVREEAPPAKKTRKSKKKKKKGKKPEPSQSTHDEDHESLDEIDRVLAELNLANSQPSGSPEAYQNQASADQLAELLKINFQHLRAMNELRKMFGDTGHDVELENQPPPPRRRGMQQQVNLEAFLSAPPEPRHKPKGTVDTVLRPNPFIEVKKNWPRGSAHGLKMEHLTTDHQGISHFTFAHDKNYEELEASFFGLVQMYDPMQLVHFLHRYPFHVSSLIQVSKVAKQQDQNTALAHDLIERALYAFGRVSLTQFRKKVEQGQARLDFYRPENRQLFLAGYNMIKYLMSKGTIRTALEWTKLLLGLDPHDPYGLINWIHPLAIRAYEAQWFIDLCTKTNFLSDSSFSSPDLYLKQTLVLAHLQLKDRERAREVLLEGLHSAPWIYCTLFSALNIDAPKCVWGVRPRDDMEQLYTDLYIHMTKDLWDTATVMDFLTSIASSAPRNQEYNSLPSLSSGVSLATARFIYLDNTPDLMSLVPRAMLHGQQPNFDFDPLPPPREQNVFTSLVQEMPWTIADNDGGGAGARGAPIEGNLRRDVINNMRRLIRAGADIPDDQLDRIAQLVADEAVMGEIRGELDELRRTRREREMEIQRERERVLQQGGGGAPRRAFQATVADAVGDDDDEEEVVLDEARASEPGDNATNNDSENSVYNMFLRVAGMLGRGGASAPGGQGEAARDTQGLPEQVYRAFEDLELPSIPGGWDFDEVDGDYSAITGLGRHDEDEGGEGGEAGESGRQNN